MSDENRTEAFVGWLRGRGVELSSGELSLIAGFIAIAGRRPVNSDDIQRGTYLATESAIADRTQLDALGTLLLEFEAHRAVTASEAVPARTTAPLKLTIRASSKMPVIERPPSELPVIIERVDPVEPSGPVFKIAAAERSGPVEQLAAEASAPVDAPIKRKPIGNRLVPSVKMPALTMPAPADAAPPTAAEPVAPPTAAESTVPTRWSQRRRWALAAAAGGGLVAAAVAFGASHMRPHAKAPVAPAAQPQAAAVHNEVGFQRLRRLGVAVQLPAGWREASESELRSVAGSQNATMVFRGGVPTDPEHGVFVAALAGREVDLVAAARLAERGVIRQLGVDAGVYHPAGCALVDLGGRTGTCRGAAAHGSDHIVVQTYVRSVGDQSVVVLSLAKSPQASADADAIVASLAPTPSAAAPSTASLTQ